MATPVPLNGETEPDPATASMVATSWTPTATVPATSPVGHPIFDSLGGDVKHKPLSGPMACDGPSRRI